jgi:hypothetical protein
MRTRIWKEKTKHEEKIENNKNKEGYDRQLKPCHP